MNRHIIVLTKEDLTEAWGALTELCEAHGFPYHSLKAKKYPFEHEGWHFKKVSFRTLAGFGEVKKCKCEMPAKVKGRKMCYRCKNYLD